MSNVAEVAGGTTEEPAVRTVRREVANLRNAAVAQEYLRQRTIIDESAARRREEYQFWESLQTDEGWV